MRAVEPGYNRPIQLGPVSREAERTIANACPGARVSPWPQHDDVHPHWGPLGRVETGHATDEALRFAGSSGGAITALAIHALRSGLVDRILHIAADPKHPTRNVVQISRSPEEIVAGAGSRYAPSSPLAEIDQALCEGGQMLFIGKPCDVSALRQLAFLDPRVNSHIPFVLSFFCGGIPSHRGVEKILSSMEIDPPTVTRFRFRGQGWPGRTIAETDSGVSKEMSYEDSWGGYLSKEVQFRCKICPDAVGGSADIACADAWYGGETGYPTFEELDGRSLIVTRTEAGERLRSSAVAAGVLAANALPSREVALMQPSQANRKSLIRARLAALSVTFQPKPQVTGLLVDEAARQAGFLSQLRNFLGTIRRVIINRR